MSLWRQLTYGLRALLASRRRGEELAEEAAHFYEAQREELEAQGMSAEQARRETQLRHGRVDDAAHRAGAYGWEQGAGRWWASLRFAARQLARHRTFTLTAVVTLALGIGANTAVFTVIEGVLLAPLPYAHADRICQLETHYTDRAGTGSTPTLPRVTGPDALDVRSQASIVAAVSLYQQAELGVQVRGHAAYTQVALTDAQFLKVFSLRPVAGALFSSDSPLSAEVSEQFARDNFGSAQQAIGKTIHSEAYAVPILGVLPGWFHFPANTQVWVNDTAMQPAAESRTAFNYKAVALLQPGISLPAAQASLASLSLQLQHAYPKDNRAKELQLLPLQKALTGEARPTLLLLFGAVALVLLIACVNVTHLQLVRATERQREIAIRKALGATRWQVLQPVLLESLLVSLLGACAGILLALPAVRLLVALAPAELPHAARLLPDAHVLVFTLGAAVFAAVASSLLPARSAARVDPGAALKQDSTRGLRRGAATRLRNGMVLAEVTLTFLLAVGAGLLLHTMAVLMTRSLGYNAQQLLVVDTDIPANTLPQELDAARQLHALFSRLRALPGVVSVGGIMGLPMGSYGSNGNYWTRGGLPVDPDHPAWANWSLTSPQYFGAMQIPLREGRDFTEADAYTSQPVVIISDSLARQSFGSADPLGRQLRCGLDSDKWMTIVGVSGNVRQDSPANAPGPTLYMPLTQHPFMANQLHIVLRTHAAPLTLMHAAAQQIHAVSPAAALRFTTMDAMVGTAVAAERFRAILLSCFAALGVALAMLGVYGTLAYTVAQRTFEIGLRMALGADRGVILRGLLTHAARLVLAGIVAGLVLSLALTRLLGSMLVGVAPLDPLSLGLAAILLVVSGLAAAYVPGRRATRINPTVALRAE